MGILNIKKDHLKKSSDDSKAVSAKDIPKAVGVAMPVAMGIIAVVKTGDVLKTVAEATKAADVLKDILPGDWIKTEVTTPAGGGGALLASAITTFVSGVSQLTLACVRLAKLRELKNDVKGMEEAVDKSVQAFDAISAKAQMALNKINEKKNAHALTVNLCRKFVINMLGYRRDLESLHSSLNQVWDKLQQAVSAANEAKESSSWGIAGTVGTIIGGAATIVAGAVAAPVLGGIAIASIVISGLGVAAAISGMVIEIVNLVEAEAIMKSCEEIETQLKDILKRVTSTVEDFKEQIAEMETVLEELDGDDDDA